MWPRSLPTTTSPRWPCSTSPGWPKLHVVEHAYCGDWTNWFVPNAAAAQAMLRASGFDVVEKVEQEVYLCRRRELDPARGPYAIYPARGGR